MGTEQLWEEDSYGKGRSQPWERKKTPVGRRRLWEENDIAAEKEDSCWKGRRQLLEED